ncbi:MAG TPA: hypothetical protein VFW13_07260 [Phenylobacterium sp.]|nr:hypothetical protein [Phenylobacterium sp.]
MQTQDDRAWAWPVLTPLIIVQLWAAHAVAFFAHEYAHAVVAWALGWKNNPFAIDYAKPSIAVFLIQLGINQSVDEGPIFAAGRAADVAMIGVAGSLLGNALLTYPLSRLGYHRARKHNRRGWAMFAFWITTASIGNFIDYVPIRTFTGGLGDMGSLEKGFGWSPWIVLVVLGIPILMATLHFFLKIVPATVTWLFPNSPRLRLGVAFLAVFVVLGFYGAAGLLDGGPTSHKLSLVSVFVALPLMMGVEFLLLRRPLGAEEMLS